LATFLCFKNGCIGCRTATEKSHVPAKSSHGLKFFLSHCRNQNDVARSVMALSNNRITVWILGN